MCVKMGETMHVNVDDFDSEDSDSFHFNYLRIYNGNGISITEICRTFSYKCTCNMHH